MILLGITTKQFKMADLKTLAESLVNLTVKEVSDLADILKDDYGIEPAAAAVAVAAPGAGGGGGAAAEEQTEFTVVLTSAGAGKLKVVKEVKGLLGLNFALFIEILHIAIGSFSLPILRVSR